jgi:hypothetical protein
VRVGACGEPVATKPAVPAATARAAVAGGRCSASAAITAVAPDHSGRATAGVRAKHPVAAATARPAVAAGAVGTRSGASATRGAAAADRSSRRAPSAAGAG